MKNGAVILDVDGTLVDSNDAHARAWVDAFAGHGITVPYVRAHDQSSFAQLTSLTSRTS
jgi:beta-phosphoglucomutase-like phosphatase (HAD superfamily)